MTKVNDLTGQKFGRLTVIERAGSNSNGRALWRCHCECGNEIIRTGNTLLQGNTKSCGCLVADASSENGKKRATHGLSNSRLFHVWMDMRVRCRDKNEKSYKNYGGRGIKVCEEWNNDFLSFYEWSISSGYDESAPRGSYTLERINTNGDYSPENCKWVTMQEQQNNKRCNRFITYNGKTQTMAQWARELNINYTLLKSRFRSGWSVEKAFTTPVKKSHK